MPWYVFWSDFRSFGQNWQGKSGRKHVEGRTHEENKKKHTQQSVRAHKHLCVRTRRNFHVCVCTTTCAYAQVPIQQSVRTHTSVRMHRYQRVTSLMKHVTRNFGGVLAQFWVCWNQIEMLYEGNFMPYEGSILRIGTTHFRSSFRVV